MMYFQTQGRKDIPCQLIKGKRPDSFQNETDDFESLKSPLRDQSSDAFAKSLSETQYSINESCE